MGNEPPDTVLFRGPGWCNARGIRAPRTITPCSQSFTQPLEGLRVTHRVHRLLR